MNRITLMDARTVCGFIAFVTRLREQRRDYVVREIKREERGAYFLFPALEMLMDN